MMRQGLAGAPGFIPLSPGRADSVMLRPSLRLRRAGAAKAGEMGRGQVPRQVLTARAAAHAVGSPPALTFDAEEGEVILRRAGAAMAQLIDAPSAETRWVCMDACKRNHPGRCETGCRP